MDRIIYQRANLMCDVKRAFEMLTANELLQSWLAPAADIEPREGGKYELFWEPENRKDNSTLGCKVTALEPNRFLSFEWRGPVQFRHFMNETDPLTHVVVFFFPLGEGSSSGTEVHLIHSGWRGSAEWEEARAYFVRAWQLAFEELERQVNTS